MTRRGLFKALASVFVAKKMPKPVPQWEGTITGDVVIKDNTFSVAKDGVRILYFNPREYHGEWRFTGPERGGFIQPNGGGHT